LIVIPDAAEVALLEDILGAHDLAVKLFVNDHVPGPPDLAGSYTAATFPGYAPHVLTLSDWTLFPGDENEPGRAESPVQSWVQTDEAPTELVYGYFVTRADTGELRWAERWGAPAPFAMAHAGDHIEMAALLTLRAET
jgi:hypothetical protein